MSKTGSSAIVHAGSLSRHPAVVAWRTVHPGRRRVTSVEVLSPVKRKSAVFRLNGAGPGSTAVIAKRTQSDQLGAEPRLYAEVFPAISISTLELYGYLEEADGYSWLFLEDAGDVWFTPAIPEHRSLAVEWLASLHSGIVTPQPWFPDCGPEYFRSVVTLAHSAITANLRHPGLAGDDSQVLSTILSHLETAESKWDGVEAACAAVPRALVHGDFKPKNVRVRAKDGRLHLVAFDWETAGWAPLAVDVGLLPDESRRLYLELVRGTWPGLEWVDVERMARLGRLFRLLHYVYWETASFRYEWIARALRHMRDYENDLRAVVREQAWIRS